MATEDEVEATELFEQVLLKFADLHDRIRDLEGDVAELINRSGVSWDRIGETTGRSRQAAKKWYRGSKGRPHRRPRSEPGDA